MNNKVNVTDKVTFSKERLLSFFSIIMISFLMYLAALYIYKENNSLTFVLYFLFTFIGMSICYISGYYFNGFVFERIFRRKKLIRILSFLAMLGVDIVYYHLVSTVISLCLTPEMLSFEEVLRWESFSLTYTAVRWPCIFRFAFLGVTH